MSTILNMNPATATVTLVSQMQGLMNVAEKMDQVFNGFDSLLIVNLTVIG